MNTINIISSIIIIITIIIVKDIIVISAGAREQLGGENRAHVAFRDVGHLYAQEATLHLSFQLPLQQLPRHLRQVHQQLDKLQRIDDTCFQKLQPRMREQLLEIHAWPTTFGERQQDIQKRSFALIASVLGLVAGATMLGLSTAAIANMKTQVHQVEHDLRKLQIDVGHRLVAHAQAINRLEKQINCNRLHILLVESKDKLQQITVGINHLVSQHTITPSILPISSVQEMWPQIQKFIKDHQLNGQLLQPHSIYEFPSGYVFDGQQLKVTIHLPVVLNEYQLYVHEPFPLKTPGGPKEVLLDRQFIAVGQRGHAVLSSHQLAACTRRFQHYFCLTPHVYTRFKETCIGALFYGAAEVIADRCHLRAYKETSAYISLNGGAFQVFMAEAERGRWACTNGTMSLITIPTGFSEWRHEPDCSLHTDAFAIERHNNFHLNIGPIAVITWPEETTTVSTHLNISADQAIASDDYFQHPNFNLTISIFGATIACLVVTTPILCVCVYLRYKQFKIAQTGSSVQAS